MSNSKRNVAPIKNTKQRYSIIIHTASPSSKTKTWGNKSLLPINNTTTLVQHQLNVINNVFTNPEIILVTGFEAEKVMNNTPYGIIKVENEKYEETNDIRSIGLGLRACTTNRVLVINGDVLFNEATLRNGKFNNKSSILINNEEDNNTEEIGCTVDNGKLEYILWGLARPWQQITYFTGQELEGLQSIAWNKNKSKLFLFEAIDIIVKNGGNFTAQHPNDMKLVIIKSSNDIQKMKTHAHYIHAH